jgi:hypothetical protein
MTKSPRKIEGKDQECSERWRKEGPITDRGYRYRAASCPPRGERICAFCGSARNVEIGHIDGFEEHGEPGNLIWICRPDNTRLGAIFARLKMGRRTRQYNPTGKGATNLGQWMQSVLSVRGESDAMTVPAAVAMIRATPPGRRSEFAREIWARRRQHGTDKTGLPF